MNNFAITTLDKVNEGTYGYMVKLDTTNIIAYDIEFIQVQDSTTSISSAPSDSSQTLRTLASYLENEEAPKLAFNYTHGMCTIFLKTADYAYVADTLITLYGKRNAIKLESSGDKADFPDEMIELFSAYAIKFASLLRGRAIPADVNRIIMREEYAIKNAE